jgi:TPR repeat protein
MSKLSGKNQVLLGIAIAGIVALVVVSYQKDRTLRLVKACDAAVASPYDNTRPAGVPGVPVDEIIASQAIAACREASDDQPDNARMRYQYGRALHAGKQTAQALAVYQQARGMGSIMAMHSIGVIYLNGSPEVPKDAQVALKWFERAAESGLPISRRVLAEMLENGEGIAAADPERAAIQWRALADSGDVEAAEHVGLAIKAQQIAPLSSEELWNRLSTAAEGHRTLALIEAAHLLRTKNARTPEQIQLGANYALAGYRAALKSPLNSEEGWPVYPWRAFSLFTYFTEAGAHNDMTAEEAQTAAADFSGPIRQFTVPIDCAGTKVPFQFYLWQWARSYPQSDTQFKWLRAARGCTVQESVITSFQKIYAIAAENNVNFPELAAEALNPKTGGPEQQPVEKMAEAAVAGQTVKSGLSTGEAVGAAVATGLTALACWYWSDQCKELAMEAAKQGVRELVKSK